MSGSIAAQPTDPELEETTWDLEPLLEGEGEEGIATRLGQALARSRAFAERYAGRLEELDSAGLAQAMTELGAIQELLARTGTYAGLRFSVNTADPAAGALLQSVQERATEMETILLFFELQWAALPEDKVERLLDDGALDFCRHHLRNVRRYREHLLSEPEERILTEKSLTSSTAWARLFEEQTSALEVELPDGKVALDVALSRLTDPDREVRRTSAEAVTAALAPGLRTRAFVYNTLLVDKAVEDRLRRFPSWISARNLSNEVSDESVGALVEAVRGRYEIARRWYRLKARLLGIEQLADYDRMAAIGADEQTFEFGAARELVLDCYQGFSPRLGAIARALFEHHHIDGPVRPGKRGGAFCAGSVPSVEPYVMLNFTARRRDVLTLAHELGHAVHFSLAAAQGIFHQQTPLTVAETASVFGETIVFARLLEEDSSPASRLALLAEHIEGTIATVFRQVAMNRFEDLAHTKRAAEGELSVERLGELWVMAQREFLGDSVELTEGYSSWWSYVPHFISTPGYVYAYAYGELLALSIYERYLEQGPDFVEQYLSLLSAGGSRSPQELGEIVGVNLSDPGFWDAGLELVAGQLEQAERAAAQLTQ